MTPANNSAVSVNDYSDYTLRAHARARAMCAYL